MRVLYLRFEIGIVEMQLLAILPAIVKLTKYTFKSYLPGGDAYNLGRGPSLLQEMHKKETDSVPLHNKFSETVFAVYDRLITVKPVIKLLAAEATVMFCLNKTAEYLKTKSEVEINVIMERAKKDTKHYQEEMRKRHVEITRRKKENLEKKMKKEAELEAYREKVTLEITKGIIRHGLFQTENEVDVKMKLLKSKEERCEALIANLKLRKNILKQKTEQKELLNLTKTKRKKRGKSLQRI